MDLDFNKNEDQLKQLCFQLQSKVKKTSLAEAKRKSKNNTTKENLPLAKELNTSQIKILNFWMLAFSQEMACIRAGWLPIRRCSNGIRLYQGTTMC